MKQIWAVLAVLLLINPAIAETGDMTETIQEIKNRHQAQLMSIPGVVSVGIGKDDQGNPAIIVGLEGAQQHGKISTIPETLEGYPVVIRTIGPVRVQ